MSQERPNGFKYNPELILDPSEDQKPLEIGDYIMIRDYDEVAAGLELLGESSWIHENYGEGISSHSDFKPYTGIALKITSAPDPGDRFNIRVDKDLIQDDIRRDASPSFAREEVFRLGGPDYPECYAQKQAQGNISDEYALAKGRHQLKQEL